MFNQFLFRFGLTTFIIFVVSFTIEGSIYSSYPASYNHYSNHPSSCTKCAPQPPDCTNTSTAPQNGGPACSCTLQVFVQGCALKPCTSASDIPCDCSGSTDTSKYCHRFRCNGVGGACETCDATYPPYCNENSTDPKDGGAPCSCAPGFYLDGCSLAPCRNDGSSGQVCTCSPGVQALACFNPRCAGSFKNGTTTTSTTTTSAHSHSIKSNPTTITSSNDKSFPMYASTTNIKSTPITTTTANTKSTPSTTNTKSSPVTTTNTKSSPTTTNTKSSPTTTNTKSMPTTTKFFPTTTNFKPTTKESTVQNSNVVNSLASLISLDLLSSNGNQNSGLLGSILGG